MRFLSRLGSAILVLCVVLVLVLRLTATHVKAEPNYRNNFTADTSVSSTFRIRAETTDGYMTVTGHGTAFGIDLSEYGYDQPRYCLTACHVIRDHDGSMRPVLKVELKNEKGIYWSNCKVMAFDAALDIGLLECESDLPSRARFADQDSIAGSPVLLVGCPTGICPTPYGGYLTEREGLERASAHVEFFKQGCSGGPIFDGNSYKVIGLAVAGIRSGRGYEEMDPHTSLFIPLDRIKHFIQVRLPARKIAPRDVPVIAFISEAASRASVTVDETILAEIVELPKAPGEAVQADETRAEVVDLQDFGKR